MCFTVKKIAGLFKEKLVYYSISRKLEDGYMKKLFTVLLPCVVLAGICEEVKLSDHAPIPPYRVESKREVFGLCEMILNINGQLVPIYATKDFIISGEMFSYRRQITQRQLEIVKRKVIKENLSKIETLRYFSYKPKGAKEGKYFYFISDPDCPYCQRVKDKVKELADRYGWEVRIIWYPLPFHREAKPKAVAHYCENRTYEDYLRDDYGKEQCEEGRKAVEKNLRVLRSIVKGTPTFVFPGGEVVVGANLKRLEEVMR